jgi:nitrogen fixation protein NifB
MTSTCKEVSKIVKAKGAFLHNVMPLIAEPEHGTFYGVMGSAARPAELKALQDACEGDMNMMRHCRQCRADAVGLLGEDRGAEFTLDKIDVMEIDYEAAMVRRKAVHDEIIEKLDAKRGIVKPKTRGHPGRFAPGADGGGRQERRRRRALRPCQGIPDLRSLAGRRALHQPPQDRAVLRRHGFLRRWRCRRGGATESLLDRNIRVLEGCEVVLCSKVGYEPWAKLEAAGIAPNGEHAMEPIEDAVMAVYKEIAATGKLLPAAESLKVA